jgi:RNA polymerase sigma factor (sigma-70 family)
MEEIVLPFEGDESKEKIISDIQEINIARILSCSRRTIDSYVEKGLLPEPVSEKEGILYFSKDAVVEALGLKNLDESLISIHEAAKILNVNIVFIESLVKEGRFTEIRLKGNIKSKRFYLKREIEEFDIEIEMVSKPLSLRKENRLIKILFSDTNSTVIQHLLTDREFEILKMVYVDKKNYEEIGAYYDLTKQRVSQIFEKAMRKLETRLKNAIPIMKRMVEQETLLDMELKYAEKFEEQVRKLNDLNVFIEHAQVKINIVPNIKKSVIENYYDVLKSTPLIDVMKIKIGDLDFSVRTLNCMKRYNVETIGDLVSLTEKDLIEFRNFGKTSLEEINKLLSNLDLKLGMKIPTDKSEFWGNYNPISHKKGL